MKNYVELERLGYVLPQDLTIGLILNGITSDFAGFIRNYNMHNMGKTVGELHAMLIEYEKGIPKEAETQVMMIKGGKIQKSNKKSLKAKCKGKANGKGKDKQVYIPKPKNPKPSAKEHPTKDDACHHYKEVGHWKRNCLVYLADLLKKKKQVGSASPSGIFTIELFAFPNKYWVYDTSRVEAIGSFDLVLPNGLVICLDNCHYAPSITRGVVSVHRLVENGFVQHFTDFGISISKYNVHYFNAIPSNGIYEIDMHNLVPNVNSMYNLTPPYTPQHNGVSERRNRTTLPLSFWDYALKSATRILNMVPTKKVDKTPYELWYGKIPNLSYLKVWGCEALVKRDTPDKLQQIYVKCIFIGYPKETMGYYFNFPPKNKIFVA
ncbi:retrotransposon protein, putative, ty1-copia subclass, partial [Tanacetum coccineum]